MLRHQAARRPARLGMRAVFVDVLLVTVAALCFAAGLGLRHREQPIRHGVVTSGRVVARPAHQDEEGGVYHTAVVEYRVGELGSERLEVMGRDGDLGEVLAVRYDPGRPSRAQLVDPPYRGLWRIFVGLGVVVALLTLWMWWRLWAGRRA